jgi:pseudouridine kinase
MRGQGSKVAVYGGANIDIQAQCRDRWRPADSNPGTSTLTAGGVGRNIAANLARLGLETELVTVFGGDQMARVLVDACCADGIRTDRSLTLAGSESSRYVCIIDADGTLVGAVASMDILDRLDPRELALRYGPGDEADIVVIDANLPAGTIEAAALRWRSRPLVLDTVSVAKARKAAKVAGCFSVVKPNLPEARALLGLEPPDTLADTIGLASASARSLLGLGVGEVFISLGARGILWADAAGMGVARPLGLPVVNVSGAGDAATAALAWSAALGYDAHFKAACAVAAASLCASGSDAVSAAMGTKSLMELVRGVVNERIS